MTVTTSIDVDGCVTVTVDDTKADDDLPRPLSALTLEDLARQSATTALGLWFSLRDGDDDNAA